MPENRKRDSRLVTEERMRKKALRRKRAMRNRMIFGLVMAVIIVLIILFIRFLFIKLAPEADSTRLTLRKNGSIRLEERVDTESLPDSASAIEKSLKSDINSYNKNNKKKVGLVRINSHKDSLYVETTYPDIASYNKFSGYKLSLMDTSKSGKVDTVFYKVVSGKKGKSFSTEKALKSGKKIFSINENIKVSLPGRVTAVSEGASVSGNTVTIKPADGNYDYAAVTYIIYK